jgi:hypothetical protein
MGVVNVKQIPIRFVPTSIKAYSLGKSILGFKDLLAAIEKL